MHSVHGKPGSIFISFTVTLIDAKHTRVLQTELHFKFLISIDEHGAAYTKHFTHGSPQAEVSCNCMIVYTVLHRKLMCDRRLELPWNFWPLSLVNLPHEYRSTIRVRSLPRNTDPNLHAARWNARAKYVEQYLATKVNTAYTGAAVYPRKRGTTQQKVVATVIGSDYKEITYASVRDCTVTEGEEMAVVLVAAESYRSNKSLTILTDSKEACRNYINGRIGHKALQISLCAGQHERRVRQHFLDTGTPWN